MTKDEAIKFYDTQEWSDMTYLERAVFQINEPRLCMPFAIFHMAVEKSLNRPVWSHEFSNTKRVRAMKKELDEIKRIKSYV